jgi:DNA-binding transcriptional LysR family regulator
MLLNRFTVKAKFRHMQLLIKLAELGSMRRAAEAANMTQPAVSQQVSELERMMETELFFRHSKGVELTEAAKDLLPVARRILAALEDGSERIANRLASLSGTVRVAATPAAIGGILSGTLARFAVANPQIHVRISEFNVSDPLSLARDDGVDIICARQPNIVPHNWVFDRCVDDRLVVACGRGHPLARAGRATPEELGKCKWLLNRVGSVARTRFEEAFKSFDWPEEARCPLVFQIPVLTKEFLSSGDYLAVMPESVTLPWLREGTICLIETELTKPLPPLGILRRDDVAGGATERLANFLTRHVGQ